MDTALFSTYPSKVGDILQKIRTGEIALPDLQRPFVWESAKVRNLFDSMNKGFPVGYVMLWKFPDDYDPAERSSSIGRGGPLPVRSLLIDGQQRLTALLAAMDGVSIKDKHYQDRRIRISFSPLANAEDGRPIGRFAVWDNAKEKDPEWISDISEYFRLVAENPSKTYDFFRNYLDAVNAAREKKKMPALTRDEEGLINTNLGNLLSLRSYSLPTVEISSDASEEDVAEIFVRVNSGGQKLMEKNFIETLLAVYDNEIHQKISSFCESARIPKDGTSYNPIIEPLPSHLIRAAVAVGFNRARLKYAYMLMRGRDLATGKTSRETQRQNLEKFRGAVDQVTNLNNWHDFLNLFAAAGYIKRSLIASENAVILSYALYLIGKYQFNVPAIKLRSQLTRYIFAVTVTQAYSVSPESFTEKQLAALQNCRTADDFLSYIDRFVATRLTESYFEITLPTDMLTTSSTRAPAWSAFAAAQIVLGAQGWLGTTAVSTLLSVGSSGTKRAYDRHHIFPKDYLNSIGVKDPVEFNQVANLIFIDYPTNIAISNKAPAVYAPEFRAKLGEEAFRKTCLENAIPADFDKMEYFDFLKARRVLMAKIIKAAFEKLSASYRSLCGSNN